MNIISNGDLLFLAADTSRKYLKDDVSMYLWYVPYNPEKLSLEKDPPLHVDEIYAADPHLVDEF